MRFLSLAFLFTALVGAVPAEHNAAGVEERDALPGHGGYKHCPTKTVYKTKYKTVYKTKYEKIYKTKTEYDTVTKYKTKTVTAYVYSSAKPFSNPMTSANTLLPVSAR